MRTGSAAPSPASPTKSSNATEAWKISRIVGVRTRGVHLARRLARSLREITGHEVPTGALDITLYRDDLMRQPVGPQPLVRRTEIPFSIDESEDSAGGRRAVYGPDDAGGPRRPDRLRPSRSIQLIVLVDRGHRELPIKADYVGKNLPTSPEESVQVCLQESDDRDEVRVAGRCRHARVRQRRTRRSSKPRRRLRSRNLLGIADLSPEEISLILDTAEAMKEIGLRPIKKVPALRGKTVVNLFFEPSTRTRTSFEIAEKRLSADTLNIAIASSSVVKGETLVDTALNLEAMHPDMIVLRHASSGACHLLSRICRSAIINAGDGMHEHPTQALLDAFTIREHKTRLAGLEGRHHRGSAAQPGAAVERSSADEDGRRCVGMRSPDADSRRTSPGSACARPVASTKRLRTPTWSCCCESSSSGWKAPSFHRCASTSTCSG